MGGPLGEQGDIEDIEGSACIRCPWHGRRVRAWAALYLWTLPTISDKISCWPRRKAPICSCLRICCVHGSQFDLASGCQIEKGLLGDLCRSEPQQRVHPVYNGGDGWIWCVPHCLQTSMKTHACVHAGQAGRSMWHADTQEVHWCMHSRHTLTMFCPCCRANPQPKTLQRQAILAAGRT